MSVESEAPGAPERQAPAPPPERKLSLAGKAWREITAFGKAILWFLPIYFVVTTAALGNYVIPSESMVPTLEVGDRIVVNKFAYGYSRHSLPLNIGLLLPPSDHRLFERMPERGDVVVFIHPQNGETMIKRLIGLPGDVIELRRGRLYVNNKETMLEGGAVHTRQPSNRAGPEHYASYEETLPNGVRHPIHDLPFATPFDNFGPYTVPARNFFFMGDNRDNSRDSRWSGMGPVPMENLIGRAETVYWAQPNCRGQDCDERQRWFRPMRD